MSNFRLNPLVVTVDHWRRLVNYDTNKPAIFTRLIVAALPPGLGVLSFHQDWRLTGTGDLVDTLGLLAGVFISSFGILLTLRMAGTTKNPGVIDRRVAKGLDEGAMALLAAGFTSGVTAGLLAVLSVTGGEGVSRISSAIVTALGAWVALYFLLAIGRLYVAYTDAFPPPWSVKNHVRGQIAPEDSPIALGERVAQRRK